jgi:hypothetical protein
LQLTQQNYQPRLGTSRLRHSHSHSHRHRHRHRDRATVYGCIRMTSILKVQYCYKYRYSTYFTRFQNTRVLCLSILSHRTHTIAYTIQYIQHLCILSIYTIYTIIYTIQNIRYTIIWNMSFVLLHDIPAAHGSCSTLKKMLYSEEDAPPRKKIGHFLRH